MKPQYKIQVICAIFILEQLCHSGFTRNTDYSLIRQHSTHCPSPLTFFEGRISQSHLGAEGVGGWCP